MRRPIQFAAVACLLVSLPLLSEESGIAWTFEALVREAKTTHPSVIARQRSKDAALAEVAAAGWQRYPMPGIEASRDDDGEHKTVLFLQQPLWTGGRITAGIDAAQARHGAANEAVSAIRRTLLLRLVDAWAEARRRLAQQAILYRNVQQHERLLAMIERRVERAVSPMVDRELARSRLYQAANELSLVSQQLAASLTRLSELVGQPVTAVEQSETDEPVLVGLPEGRGQALELAVAASPVLAGLGFEYEAAEADVKAEWAAYSPRLALRMEWQRDDVETDKRAMLVLESQLGAGLSTGSKVTAATARRDALSEERRAALRELETDVAETWQQLTAARLRLNNSRINRESAATVFESWTRQYTVGQKSWQDVLNAVRESSSAALGVEDARADYFRAGLRLLVLTGAI